MVLPEFVARRALLSEDQGERRVRHVELVSEDELLLQFRLREDRRRGHFQDEEDGYDLCQEPDDQGEAPEEFEQREQEREHRSAGPPGPLYETDRLPHVLDLRPAVDQEQGPEGHAPDESRDIWVCSEDHGSAPSGPLWRPR